jgi:DNA-binding transcriptional LysR family regulator
MKMHQIRYFLAVCEEGNFTRAAKRCGVAQPSLTRAVKQLEIHLRGPLFVRSSKHCRLTELGTRIYPYFALVDRCVQEVRRQAGKPPGLSPHRLAGAPEAFMRNAGSNHHHT